MERDAVCYETPSKTAVVRNFTREPKHLVVFALRAAPKVQHWEGS